MSIGPSLPHFEPVLDVDVVTGSPDQLPRVSRRLAVIGNRYRGENGIAGRHAFRSPAGGV